MTTDLDTAREGVVEAAREGAREEVVDQISVEAWRGSPWSSTSNRLLALSSSNTLLPANLKEKKRKDYAFRRQFNEKPSVIPGCPGQQTCINCSVLASDHNQYV